MRSWSGTASTTASGSGTSPISTCSSGSSSTAPLDGVAHDLGQPVTVVPRPVGACTVGVLVESDQLGTHLLEPVDVVLAHARPQVRQYRGDALGARVAAGAD